MSPEDKHLIVFSVGVLGHHSCFLQLVLQRVHALFIGDRAMLQELSHARGWRRAFD